MPDFPLLMVYNKERDSRRMTLFPSLDYRGLYTVLVQLLEVTPLIQAGVDGITSLYCFKMRRKTVYENVDLQSKFWDNP